MTINEAPKRRIVGVSFKISIDFSSWLWTARTIKWGFYSIHFLCFHIWIDVIEK